MIFNLNRVDAYKSLHPAVLVVVLKLTSFLREL